MGARNISKLWWSMPDVQRQRYIAEAQNDRVAPQVQDRAKNLRDWVDEIDVFLKSLEPCTRCNSWDPWVSSCKRLLCKVRSCKRCGLVGYCSAECAHLNQC